MPAKIERKKAATPAPAAKAGRSDVTAVADPTRRSLFRSRVSAKKLAQFTGQLAILQSAGITIVRSLRICEKQLDAGPLKAVIGTVADDVEGGATFSEALGKNPRVFDRLFVNMVRAGEKGGILDQILLRLAQFSEKTERIKSRIREALTYPAVVLFFALAVVAFILVVIVPKFELIFQQLNQELPPVTQLLIGISRFVANYWYVVFGVPVLLYMLYRVALRNERFRLVVDKIKLHSPIAGNLIEKTIVARFSRTLGTLLASGVAILDALEIVQASIENAVLADAVDKIRASVREGETIANPLAESKVFDEMVVNMIDVGEATGSLDKMLMKIADIYEEEVDVQVGTLFKMIEPILLVGLALIVGFIVVALFLPILKVMESMSQSGR